MVIFGERAKAKYNVRRDCDELHVHYHAFAYVCVHVCALFLTLCGSSMLWSFPFIITENFHRQGEVIFVVESL